MKILNFFLELAICGNSTPWRTFVPVSAANSTEMNSVSGIKRTRVYSQLYNYQIEVFCYVK